MATASNAVSGLPYLGGGEQLLAWKVGGGVHAASRSPSADVRGGERHKHGKADNQPMNS